MVGMSRGDGMRQRIEMSQLEGEGQAGLRSHHLIEAHDPVKLGVEESARALVAAAARWRARTHEEVRSREHLSQTWRSHVHAGLPEELLTEPN